MDRAGIRVLQPICQPISGVEAHPRADTLQPGVSPEGYAPHWGARAARVSPRRSGFVRRLIAAKQEQRTETSRYSPGTCPPRSKQVPSPNLWIMER
jgi:hypothetical protein